MTDKRIKYLTLHVIVTADSYSNGKFTFSNGTKIITLKEISRSITELRRTVEDPTKSWEIILTDPFDDSDVIIRYCSKTNSYRVILP